MNEDQHREDERDLNLWLFGHRRPRHRGRVWTSTTGDRKAEHE